MNSEVDLNAKCGQDNPALFWAIISGDGNAEMVRILVAAGADVNVTDRNGRSMLYWATLEDSPEIVEILTNPAAAFFTPTVTPTVTPLPDDWIDAPQEVKVARVGSTLQISWAPVEGAEYYKVFYSRLSSRCRVEQVVSQLSCSEIAPRVDATTFIRRDLSESELFLSAVRGSYWVKACNQTRCSPFNE